MTPAPDQLVTPGLVDVHVGLALPEPAPVVGVGGAPVPLPASSPLAAIRDDLLVCPRAAGTMQVLATITDPAVVVAILTHLGAPTAPPAVAAARAPPQVPFWPGGCDPPADLDAYEPA